MEMFFEAKDIKDEKRKARLLIQVDTEAFKLIKQLIAPKKLSEVDYAAVKKTMDEHLNPKLSEVWKDVILIWLGRNRQRQWQIFLLS